MGEISPRARVRGVENIPQALAPGRRAYINIWPAKLYFQLWETAPGTAVHAV